MLSRNAGAAIDPARRRNELLDDERRLDGDHASSFHLPAGIVEKPWRRKAVEQPGPPGCAAFSPRSVRPLA